MAEDPVSPSTNVIERLEGDKWEEVANAVAPGSYRGRHIDEFGLPVFFMAYKYPEGTKYNFDTDGEYEKYIGGLGERGGEEGEK